MSEDKYTIGVVVGRFQSPYLHIGHIHLISSALRDNDVVKVIVGIANNNDDERNPYSFEHVQHQIRKIFPHVIIEKIEDVNCDTKWSLNLDKMMETDGIKYRLYHSRDSFASHYNGSIELVEVEEIPNVSATKLREKNS